jgi:hypothetical protein
MIHGLPIDGTTVCGQVSPGWWRDMVGAAIGIQPPMFPRTKRTRSCCASTPAGSQLASTPAQRALRMRPFIRTLGLVFGIWMMSYTFLF